MFGRFGDSQRASETMPRRGCPDNNLVASRLAVHYQRSSALLHRPQVVAAQEGNPEESHLQRMPSGRAWLKRTRITGARTLQKTHSSHHAQHGQPANVDLGGGLEGAKVSTGHAPTVKFASENW